MMSCAPINACATNNGGCRPGQIYTSIPSANPRNPPHASCAWPDTCAPNPCQNGGHCYSYLKTFTCVCPTGFTGAKCETQARCGVAANGQVCGGPGAGQCFAGKYVPAEAVSPVPPTLPILNCYKGSPSWQYVVQFLSGDIDHFTNNLHNAIAGGSDVKSAVVDGQYTTKEGTSVVATNPVYQSSPPPATPLPMWSLVTIGVGASLLLGIASIMLYRYKCRNPEAHKKAATTELTTVVAATGSSEISPESTLL